jgi:4-methyl-5(b-hydroxyethyl)-thiazole monophosphate biosynthesis
MACELLFLIVERADGYGTLRAIGCMLRCILHCASISPRSHPVQTSAKVLIPIAHGSESLETVSIANILRRAGITVTLASIELELVINATLDIRLQADRLLKDLQHERFDLITLPGGSKGSESLGGCASLIEMLKEQREAGRWYGAICAAPALALAPNGLLNERRATCYPSFRDRIPAFVDEPVVVDGNCVTSAGPGTAIPFALKLVELLAGADTAQKVAAAALIP